MNHTLKNLQRMALPLMLLSSMVFAQQVLVNNDFKAGMSGWKTEGSGSFTATAGTDQWGSFVNFAITNGGTNPWDVKLVQEGITLEKGYEYTLEWGATRGTGTINVGIGMGVAPYTTYIGDDIAFSGDYLDHTADNGLAVVYHHCDETVSGLRFYADMGGNNSAVKFSWASLGKVAKSCDGGTGGTGGGLTNPGIGPVSYYGELKKSGNKIIGARTKEATQVRGMSLYWTLWSGENFYNRQAIDALVSQWKCEIVRAAMGVNEAGGYAHNPGDQQAYVETVIDAAIANDIYVIVDFHTHHAEDYQTQAINFFRAIAQKYGKNDHVIFEVYNEPLKITWATVKSYATPVIAEIRKYSDNLIIVGTPNWSQDVDAAANDQINDPNVAYTLHFYAGTHGEDLRAKARTAMNKGAALMVTEWGTVNANGDGAVATTEANSWMAFMDQYKLSWANWSVQNISEGASIFKNGVSTTGSGWGSTSNMTASGQYVYGKLVGYAPKAAWRNAPTPVFSQLTSQNTSLQISKTKDGALSYRLPVQESHTLYLYDTHGAQKLVKAQSNGSEFSVGTNGLKGHYILRIHSKNAQYSKPVFLY